MSDESRFDMEKCPECGERQVFYQEACKRCGSCGWSDC